MANPWLLAVMGVLACGVSALGIWLLTPVMSRAGLIDRPNARKTHQQPTPVSGGIVMLLTVGVLMFGAFSAFDDVGRAQLGFGLAALLVTVLGALDDRYDLSWKLRVLVEIIAALLLVEVGGIRVEYLGDIFGFGSVSLGIWSVPFTVFATVGIINAVNMIDGSDGLAGTLVLVALVMLGAAAVYAGNAAVYTRIPVLVGAVAGFLLYNLRSLRGARARIFMGNAGSAFLGLTIACFSFRLTQNPAHPVGPILALWLIPIPIMDCLVLIARRLRHGRSPFVADRNHIHHHMREAGFGPNRIAFALAAFSLCTGLVAGITLRLHLPQLVLVAGFALLCIFYFWLTSRRARAVAFFRVLRHPFARLPAAEPAKPQAQTGK